MSIGDGYLTGTVINEQRDGLPGVMMKLTKNGPPQIQVTNAMGEFRYVSLSPGDYMIEAFLEGYETAQEPVTIDAGKGADLRITLKPAVID